MDLEVIEKECVMYFFTPHSYIVNGDWVDLCYNCQTGVKDVVCPIDNKKRIIQLEMDITRIISNIFTA